MTVRMTTVTFAPRDGEQQLAIFDWAKERFCLSDSTIKDGEGPKYKPYFFFGDPTSCIGCGSWHTLHLADELRASLVVGFVMSVCHPYREDTPIKLGEIIAIN